MAEGNRLSSYLANLSPGKTVLWCYLLWYLNTVVHHFDPTPRIWLNSLGICGLIGFALVLSVGSIKTAMANKWQTFRLFLMPFCVSSFSSLIKGKGFFLILSPSAKEVALSAGLCAGFTAITLWLKKTHSQAPG